MIIMLFMMDRYCVSHGIQIQSTSSNNNVPEYDLCVTLISFF